MSSDQPKPAVRSWAILPTACLILVIGWLIDRHHLNRALEDKLHQNRRLTTTIERLKTQIVSRFIAAKIRDRSVDHATWRTVADTVHRQKPAGENAAAIWKAVSETHRDSKLIAYHFHLKNVSDRADEAVPYDVHIFANESGLVVAVGSEQGLATSSGNSGPCVSIYQNEHWHLKFL